LGRPLRRWWIQALTQTFSGADLLVLKGDSKEAGRGKPKEAGTD
jgi:hypothetical protein